MNAFPMIRAVFSIGLIPQLAPADIDSGGRMSSGGEIFTHSSIGVAFATTPSQGGATSSDPGLIEVLYPVTALSTTDVNGNGLPDS